MVINSLQAGISGVARINHSRRGILIHSALNTLVEFIDIKRIDLAIGDRLREIRFPAHSIVQGNFGRGFPCIGRIDGEESLLHVVAVRSSLKEGGDLPGHEIAQPQASRLTIDRECPR